jgi:hypothetical protein
VIAVTPGATYNIVVGAAGAAGTTGNGGNGGDSQVLDPKGNIIIFAGGGQGGGAGTSTSCGAMGAGGQTDPNAAISHGPFPFLYNYFCGSPLPNFPYNWAVAQGLGANGVGFGGYNVSREPPAPFDLDADGFPGYVLLVW